MKMFASRLVLATMLLPGGAALAAPLPAPLRAEVNGLLDHLQSSGCEFNRNGSWYAAGEARAHLQSKLEYLEGKDTIHSTEQFIELGASTSSMSGKCQYRAMAKSITPPLPCVPASWAPALAWW